jgi:glycosyl transferase family 87
MSPRIRVAGIAASLSALTALILLLARPSIDPARIKPIVLVGAAWIAFGCAAWLLRKVTVRLAVGLILIGGIAIQLVALAGPPQDSSDLYRYIWDGRVQAAGIDPYLYAPSAAGVARLRDDFLWSGKGPGQYADCVTKRVDHLDPAYSRVAGCTKLNRPKVPTVYPPVAEAYFFGVQLAAPADNSTTPLQAAAAAFALAVTLILLSGLRRLGKNPRLAALWAWCPTVALEAGQNGHVDVVAVALTAVALLLLARARTEGRTMLGGVLIGLAIATKVTPILVLPAVLRRGWWLISTSAATAVGLVYAPHVMAVGQKIIGFFPGYMKQEGYSTGTGFSIIGLFVNGKVATVVAACILGLIALAVLRYGDPDQPWRGGVLMTAGALAVCTPHFQWYAILLVMLVALDGRPEWLAIAAGGYLANSAHLRIDGITLHDPRAVGYGVGAMVACACALTRYALERRDRAGAAGPMPAVAGAGGGSAGAGLAPLGSADVVSADIAPADVAPADIAPADVAPADIASVNAAALSEAVVEPTAVYGPAVTVTIGANGMPSFATAGPPDGGASGASGASGALEPAGVSYHVLTGGGIAYRIGLIPP